MAVKAWRGSRGGLESVFFTCGEAQLVGVVQHGVEVLHPVGGDRPVHPQPGGGVPVVRPALPQHAAQRAILHIWR
eukprot:79037-Prorocentrum_minimum.AAC.1